MKFLYILVALPLLAAAAPAPVPSGYYRGVKRDEDSVLARRQATVADLKRRADYSDGHEKKEKYKPSGYYPRATDAA